MLSQLEPMHIEEYRKIRAEQNTIWGRQAKPATINRNVANFRAMINRAVEYRMLKANPIGSIKQLKERNIRERFISDEEFNILLKNCSGDLKGLVLIGYYQPMRQAEIMNLSWDEIDFDHGFIRLGGERTKNGTGRVIPMHPQVRDYLQSRQRLCGDNVFEKKNWFNRKAYKKAVMAAGLGDFTFHDLRHCAINNLRLAGNDHFLIKKASGHKTDSVFQRYNLVTEKEIKDMKWLGENVKRDVNLVTKLVTKEGFEKFEIAESKTEAGSPSRTRTSDPMINSPPKPIYAN